MSVSLLARLRLTLVLSWKRVRHPDASPWFPMTPPIQSRVYADANERMGVSWYDYGALLLVSFALRRSRLLGWVRL